MIRQWRVSFPKEALPLWYSKIFSSSSWCNLSSSSYVHTTINHKVIELQRWKLLVARANKKMTTMTPIIDLKRRSSWLKHRITLFLNILLVDCYVGKSLGRNHMVCIWRRPMSNLIDFFHHHATNGSFSWTSFTHHRTKNMLYSRTSVEWTRKVAFEVSSSSKVKSCLMTSRPCNFLTISTKSCMRFRAPQNSNHVWGFKNRAPSLTDTIFSRQLTSATWKMSCLQHFLRVSYWYQFGEKRVFPKLVPVWNA